MKKGCWECCGTDAIVAEGGGDDGEKVGGDERDGGEGKSDVQDRVKYVAYSQHTVGYLIDLSYEISVSGSPSRIYRYKLH